MKRALVVFELVLLVVLLFESFIAVYMADTEQQKYKVIQEFDEFEIRYYPEAIVASVEMKTDEVRGRSNDQFRELAGYIFGGNEQNTKIVMTAPVHMELEDSISRMSFVMPSKYKMEDLPVPENAAVKIHTLKAGYYASIKFGGFANENTITKKFEVLKGLLKDEGIGVTTESYKYLGYNPPYQVLGRRNEVIIPIEKSELKKWLD